MRNFVFAFSLIAFSLSLIANADDSETSKGDHSSLRVLEGEALAKAYQVDKEAAKDLNALLAQRLASFLACPKHDRRKSREDQHWENVSNIKWAIKEWAQTIAENNIRIDDKSFGVEEDVIDLLKSRYGMPEAEANKIATWLKAGEKSGAGGFNALLARASKDLGNGDLREDSSKPFLLGATLASKADFVADWNSKWVKYVSQADSFNSEPSKACSATAEKSAAKWSREKPHVSLAPAKVAEKRQVQSDAIAKAELAEKARRDAAAAHSPGSKKTLASGDSAASLLPIPRGGFSNPDGSQPPPSDKKDGDHTVPLLGSTVSAPGKTDSKGSTPPPKPSADLVDQDMVFEIFALEANLHIAQDKKALDRQKEIAAMPKASAEYYLKDLLARRITERKKVATEIGSHIEKLKKDFTVDQLRAQLAALGEPSLPTFGPPRGLVAPQVKTIATAKSTQIPMPTTATYKREEDRLNARKNFVAAQMTKRQQGAGGFDGADHDADADRLAQIEFEKDFDEANPRIEERRALAKDAPFTEPPSSKLVDAKVVSRILELEKAQGIARSIDPNVRKKEVAAMQASVADLYLKDLLARSITLLEKTPAAQIGSHIEDLKKNSVAQLEAKLKVLDPSHAPDPAPRSAPSPQIAGPELAQAKVVSRVLELEKQLNLPELTDDAHEERIRGLERREAQQYLKRLLAQKVIIEEEAVLKTGRDEKAKAARLQELVATPQNNRLEERLESLALMKRLAQVASRSETDPKKRAQKYQDTLNARSKDSVEKLRDDTERAELAESTQKASLREKIIVLNQEHGAPGSEAKLSAEIKDMDLGALNRKYNELVAKSEEDESDPEAVAAASRRMKRELAKKPGSLTSPLAPRMPNLPKPEFAQVDASATLRDGQPKAKLLTEHASPEKVAMPDSLKPLPPVAPEPLFAPATVPQLAALLTPPPSVSVLSSLTPQPSRAGSANPYFKGAFVAPPPKTLLETNVDYNKRLAVIEEVKTKFPDYEAIVSTAKSLEGKKDLTSDEKRILAEARKIGIFYNFLNSQPDANGVHAASKVPLRVTEDEAPK